MQMLLALAAASFLGTPAQLPQATPIVGARSLALSPDGTQLAFCYHGEIWIVPATGGRASAITNHVEMNDNPVWSPDGKYIAFSSTRNGGNDVYVTPTAGGPTVRETYGSGSKVPGDWSPDGTQICFVATRDEPHPGVFTVDVDNGRTHRLFMDIDRLDNPRFTPDGSAIVYERMANFPWTRPRYHGSGAAQLCRYDLAAKTRTVIVNNDFQHLWPQIGFDGKGVCAVSVGALTPSSSPMNHSIGKWVDSVERTPNIYAFDGGASHRLTDFTGDAGTRFLTIARKAPVAAFENLGAVYVMREGKEPKKVEIFVPQDPQETETQHVVTTTGASDARPSPKGDEMAFVLNNDIWMAPVKKEKGPNKDDATQLTDWAGLDEEPIWNPDGKSLFFVSDRDNNVRAFKLDPATKAITPVSTSDNDVFNLQLSPDKTLLSYCEAGRDGGIFTVPVAGGEPKKILATSDPKRRADLGDAYAWSPDGKYIAYVQRLTGSGFYYWDDKSNILILNVATGDVVDVTDLSANHSAPAFSPDGKYLLFISDRDGPGLYALPLKQEDAREVDLDLHYEKPKGPVTTDIDFNDISSRARRIITANVSGQVRINPNTGDIYYLEGGDLKKADFGGNHPTPVTTGGGIDSFRPNDDWTQLIYVKGGLIFTLELKPNVQPQPFAFRADYMLNVAKQHHAAFDQLWRTFNRNYYDPNFHGRDWLAIKKRYEPLLSSVGNRYEMATLCNEMIGELESSHAEVGPAAGGPKPEPVSALGFMIDYGYGGPGIKIASIPPHAPGTYPKTQLHAGEIVTAIDGHPVDLDEKLWTYLTGQDGRDVTYTVKDSAGKSRDVKFRAMSGAEWGALLYRNEIDARRKYVEEKSGGLLTYVHIRGMDQPSLVRFQEEAWQYTQGKKGLLIDVRNNGGGNTADQIIELLERTPHAYYRERNAEPVPAPGEMLPVKFAVLCSENSYSNAEMYPAAMKDAKLAPLIGMPTPGYVIWTGGLQLVDGTRARMPGSGSYRLDGTPLEDVGVKPDYEVDLTPEEYFAGKHPQLDKAIEVLLARVK